MLVNGIPVKSNYIINPGDEVEVIIPITPRPEDSEPENIPLDIIYEDDYLIIVNKPAGMVVHPSLGNFSGTMVNALLFHSQNLSSLNEAGRPGIVHRIDKNTSGLLVVAKDDWTHAELAKQFKAHSLEREYNAICWGIFKEKKGEVLGNIARSKKDRKLFTVSADDGKFAHTYFEVIEEFDFLSLIKLKLKTGRTHQIRVHMAHLNHHIFGDPEYNGRRINYGFEMPNIKQKVNILLQMMERQALHAKTLGFVHPHTKEFVKFNSNLPEDFNKVLNYIRH